MAVLVLCPHCDDQLRFDQLRTGSTLRCKTCYGQFTVTAEMLIKLDEDAGRDQGLIMDIAEMPKSPLVKNPTAKPNRPAKPKRNPSSTASNEPDVGQSVTVKRPADYYDDEMEDDEPSDQKSDRSQDWKTKLGAVVGLLAIIVGAGFGIARSLPPRQQLNPPPVAFAPPAIQMPMPMDQFQPGGLAKENADFMQKQRDEMFPHLKQIEAQIEADRKQRQAEMDDFRQQALDRMQAARQRSMNMGRFPNAGGGFRPVIIDGEIRIPNNQFGGGNFGGGNFPPGIQEMLNRHDMVPPRMNTGNKVVVPGGAVDPVKEEIGCGAASHDSLKAGATMGGTFNPFRRGTNKEPTPSIFDRGID